MVFSSTLFLFLFLPVTLLGYYVLRANLRNYWLLLVSLVFFAWSQLNYLWIILLNIAINYLCSLLIGRAPRAKKLLLILAIVGNLGLLFYFKYFDFAIASINAAFGTDLALQEIILPIGISFFTFQGMSYTVDVYRGDVAVQKDITKVALYIVLFPQLIAGPIVRYKDVAREIDTRRFALEDFTSGVQRFILGLAKKAIIANTMAQTADLIWARTPDQNTWAIAWLGSIAYTLQIYFDFSGYSDMAIGLGRMFGFHFNENFNLPYISKSVTEFWRRWHISLSTWFRDYVYIPLGGNRRHVYLNLCVVFLLTGFWHGAAWQFVAWGVWHGLFMLIERGLRSRNKLQPRGKAGTALWRVYTLAVVHFGWVLFRAADGKAALDYAATMLGLQGGGQPLFRLAWYLDGWTVFVLALGILFSTSLPRRFAGWLQKKLDGRVYLAAKYAALLGVLFCAMLRIVSGTYNPFIYFQF